MEVKHKFLPKLRLDKNWLIQQMKDSQLTVVQETVEKGLVSLVIKKVNLS
jgi:hypothetical protein